MTARMLVLQDVVDDTRPLDVPAVTDDAQPWTALVNWGPLAADGSRHLAAVPRVLHRLWERIHAPLELYLDQLLPERALVCEIVQTCAGGMVAPTHPCRIELRFLCTLTPVPPDLFDDLWGAALPPTIRLVVNAYNLLGTRSLRLTSEHPQIHFLGLVDRKRRRADASSPS